MLTYIHAYVNCDTGDTMFELPNGNGYISKTSAIKYNYKIDYSTRPVNWRGS